MLCKKYLLFVLLFVFMGTSVVLAQDEEGDAATESTSGASSSSASDDDYPYPSFRDEEYKNFVNKKRQDQQDKFLDRKYTHPARPKDKWEVGLDLGTTWISGDVKAKPGWGVGLHVRRSLGYIFSLRLAGMLGTTTGRNWQAAEGWSESSINGDPSFIPNKALAGSTLYDEYNGQFGTPDYTYVGSNGDRNGYPIYYNYKTNLRDLTLSGILNIHNIRFHKRQTRMNLYGILGFGGTAYRTFMDQLDADGNTYIDQYAEVSANNNYGFYENRRELLDALNAVWDGTYESQAERHFDDLTPFENYSFKPTGHVGLGIGLRTTRFLTLALETKVTYTNDDLLDGQRWQEWGALTRDYDTYLFNNLSLNFNVGRKNAVEPLWWMNPLDYAYSELNEAPCCDDLELPDLSDDDNDGVPNIFDEEPESREGCPVDTKGRMLDSDRDGVLDCDDSCPHSQPYSVLAGADGKRRQISLKDAVDEKGCLPAEKLNISCKDIPDLCSCAKACIPPPPPPVRAYNPCDNFAMPDVLFDLNKYSVKDAFGPQLSTVANWLKSNPGQKVCVTGHTDARSSDSYNNVLAYKRANEVINQLVTRFGISRSQLVLQYAGESQPRIAGLSTVGQKGIDADHALNRRVSFTCCPGGGMDMGMPDGPANAGSRKPRP